MKRRQVPLGVDDRSGFVVPLHTLRKEWTGRLVSDDEYEDKHPQIKRRKVPTDKTKLRDPRPDNYVESAQIHLYTNGTTPLAAAAWVNDVTVEIV